MSNVTGDQLYNWLLTQENSDNDDQRFYASYLLGHVSLTIADAEEQEGDFHALLSQSLNAALEEDTLSEQDIAGIQAMLDLGLK